MCTFVLTDNVELESENSEEISIIIFSLLKNVLYERCEIYLMIYYTCIHTHIYIFVKRLNIYINLDLYWNSYFSIFLNDTYEKKRVKTLNFCETFLLNKTAEKILH